jgi:hypothetical protein
VPRFEAGTGENRRISETAVADSVMPLLSRVNSPIEREGSRRTCPSLHCWSWEDSPKVGGTCRVCPSQQWIGGGRRWRGPEAARPPYPPSLLRLRPRGAGSSPARKWPLPRGPRRSSPRKSQDRSRVEDRRSARCLRRWRSPNRRVRGHRPNERGRPDKGRVAPGVQDSEIIGLDAEDHIGLVRRQVRGACIPVA